MDAIQEQRIGDGLRAGDVASWHALYDAFAEEIWRLVARRLGGQASSIADLVQEIFLAAAESAGSYDARRGGLRCWLRGLARRRVANHFRRQARSERATRPGAYDRASIVTLIRYLDGVIPTPPDIVARKETAALVRRVLSELPEDYELLLAGKYMDGQSAAQLAEDTNATTESVRSKLARARRAFRNRLEAISAQDGEPTPLK